MPIPTKARPKAAAKAPAGPPKAKAWKHSEANLAFETKAKDFLRFAIKQNGATYADLAAALGKAGVEITPAALENKISRGGFSAAFLFQCMDALKSNIASLPK